MKTFAFAVLASSVAAAAGAGVCAPGYWKNGNTCVQCAADSFKAFAGDHQCTKCPSEASATKDRTSCACTSATPTQRRLGSRRLLSFEEDVWEETDFDANFDMDFDRMLFDGESGSGFTGSLGSGFGSAPGSGEAHVPGGGGSFVGHGSGPVQGSGSFHGSVAPQPAPETFFFDGQKCVLRTPDTCPPGEYKSKNGNCVACAINTFKRFEGDGDCTPCPTGSRETDGADSCECPVHLPLEHRLLGGHDGHGDHTVIGGYFDGTTCSGAIGCPRGVGLEVVPNTGGITNCVACSPGKFQSIDGSAKACKDVKQCAAGEQSSPYSAQDNTICAPCPTGQFKSKAGNAACQPHVQECPAGHEAKGGDATQDATCTPCAPGTVKAGSGKGSCVPCAAGTFQKKEGQESCVAHRTCKAGEEPSPEGDAVTDTTCTPCPSGTFKANDGAGYCKAHTICGVGQYNAGGAVSATTDTICTPCVSGTFKSTIGNGKCSTCTPNYDASNVCPPGAPFSQPCTTTTDTVCPTYAAKDLAVKVASFGTPTCSDKPDIWVSGVTEAIATVTGDNGATVAVTFAAKAGADAVGAPITVPVDRGVATASFLIAASFEGKSITVTASAVARSPGKIPGTATDTSVAKTAKAAYEMAPLANFGSCSYATECKDSSESFIIGSKARPDPVCNRVVCGVITKASTLVPCLGASEVPPASTELCFKACSSTSQWVCKDGNSYGKCRPDGWTACSKQCGGGTQTRDVQWMKFANGAWAAGDGADGPNKPEESRSCNLQPCETYDIVKSAYSACPRSCKVGAKPLWQFRTVKCMAKIAKVQVSMSRCKPAENEDLTTVKNCAPGLPACAQPFRSYGRWGRCSESCGGGVSTRDVHCMDATGVKQSDDTKCSGLPRDEVPVSVQVEGDTNKDSKRKCNTNACTVLSYNIGPFGACSKTCASKGIAGTSVRSVTCQEYFPSNQTSTTVDDSKCESAKAIIGDKPSTETACATVACDPCEHYICGYGGTCSSPGGQRTCTCPAGYKEVGAGTSLPKCEKNSVPTCGASDTNCQNLGSDKCVLKLNKSACFVGFVYKSGNGFAECAGANAVLDGNGDCCPSGTVDVCNKCNGNAKVIDAFGTCCEGELDASGVCCTGIMDSCGVCDGSDECKVVVKADMPVPTLASQTPVTQPNYASATTTQRLAYDLAARPGIAEICAGGSENADQVSIDSVAVTESDVKSLRRLAQMWKQAVRRRLAASAFEPTFSVSPSQDASAGEVSLESVTESFAEATTSGAASPFTPKNIPETLTAGICGNKNCETGERCDGTNAATCCKADCPLELKSCPTPAGSDKQCGGQGTCMSASGACKCFSKKGHTGADCSGCLPGYVKGPVVDGKVTCDVEVVRQADGETIPATPAPTPAPVTPAPTPVPAAATPAPTPVPTLAPNMCKQSRDLLKAVEYEAGATCEDLSALLLSKVSGATTWDDVTKADVEGTKWMVDNSEQVLAKYIIDFGPKCCGGVGRTRFTGTSTMCVNADDFRSTAVAKSTHTCAQMGTHMLSAVGRTQWKDLTCVDMAESALLSVDPAGQKSNVYSLLKEIGTACCGSAEDTRSVASKVADGKCEADYKPLWTADGIVVKFANTLEGYSKDTFTSAVQAAYKKAVASEVGVLASAVKIFRIKDGHEPASSLLSRRRLAGGHDHDDDHDAVSFDVEIAVATNALAAVLEERVNDITDAALLAAFTAELTAANLTAPAGLSVHKNPATVAKATTDSKLGAILGGLFGGLVVIGALYYYFRVYKPKQAAPAPKNVQQAEMTPVAGALTTKSATPAPVSTV